MMFPALPEFIVAEEVLRTITNRLQVGDQTLCHAEGVKENAIRVLQDVELHLHQLGTNMLGETGSGKQNFLRILDPFRRRADLYR